MIVNVHLYPKTECSNILHGIRRYLVDMGLMQTPTIMAGDFNFDTGIEDRMDKSMNLCGKPGGAAALFHRLFSNQFSEVFQPDFTRTPGNSQDGKYSRIDRIYIST